MKNKITKVAAGYSELLSSLKERIRSYQVIANGLLTDVRLAYKLIFRAFPTKGHPFIESDMTTVVKRKFH